ncbi:MAG: hypothetical protein PF961_22540 [Planctomycetota bacterium]|jgi:hypothetical protein|nr:hypothetical protein [Planctomycetota bacterium]
MSLPIHFQWHDGACSTDLAAFRDALAARCDEACWHAEQGHLHEAVTTQGYPVLVSALGKADDLVALLVARIDVLVSLGDKADDFVYGDKLFKKDSAALTKAAETKLAASPKAPAKKQAADKAPAKKAAAEKAPVKKASSKKAPAKKAGAKKAK